MFHDVPRWLGRTVQPAINFMPETQGLLSALDGCCHPRAARLRVRLQQCTDTDELRSLRAEVLNLLALSFGASEAHRRLQIQ
ncbi:MAG: hypothetical protein LBP52_04405 [Burkholderiaceae bacterium]|jgi:hypothetical protein|nr:hypothetical protein [Burkholderiaceae bacterium]